ncbi:MAG: LPS-assembly protein LptD [Prevotellaceae bacterium]|nr:LPS-assembly protein LptD [Prevotellaceae bacterium]
MKSTRFIILVWLAACVVAMAQGGRVVGSGVSSAARMWTAVRDTVLSVPVDSLPTLDSLQLDTAQMAELDSIRRVFDDEHGTHDVAAERRGRGIQWNDSVAAAQDSIKATQKKGALETPVDYEAKDSIIFMMDSKHALLYGDAKVDYQDIHLTAEEITISMDSSLVHAVGVKDSLDKWVGKPVFTQGGDTYESEAMSYNFDTRKGFIMNVTTAQQDGFLTSQEAKKGSGDEFFMRHGTYTTCDEEHPHFYIALSRAKVHTGKSVFSGPAWLVVEDVPLPLAIPFAYFPFTSSYSSGFIMPSYGDENSRGFYLRDGGYYFAVNDFWDLRLTGEIYTKGSWGLGAQTTYKKRYKYSGNFYFNYQVTKTGEKNLPDYQEVKNFKLQWSHRQDSKASPNSSFSASVNFATQSYERNNLTSLYNPTSYSQSTRTSSVSYSRSFPKIGLSLSSSFNIAQNMRDSTIALTLPNLSISLQKLYPFKRKKLMGKERWYERISMSYSGTLSNSISTKEDQLMKSDLLKDWRNGMRHQIPVQASFQVLKYINIVPSFNYTERWYKEKVNQNWDAERNTVVRDTVYGFNRVYNYNLSLSANTKLYGFYVPNRKIFGDKIERVRHVFTPSMSFSYAPDFSASRFGYYKTYARTDADGNVSLVEYSPYSGGLYGVPGKGKTGSISWDVSNNIEMKVKSDRDSTGVKKVSIIDELGASLSYNMAAKTQPWSNLSTRLRLKWGKISLNMNTTWMTYAYQFDDNGNVIVGNRTEWSYGRFGRFQGMSKNLSYTFNNQSWRDISKKLGKLFGRRDDDDDDRDADTDWEDMEGEDGETTATTGRKGDSSGGGDGLDADGYMKFTLPWSFSISYGITMSEDRSRPINVKNMRYPYKFVHSLNFSGNIKLSSNWNINFSSGYDFTNKDISMTAINISRDMHCFNISGGLVLGTFTSYHITMRANASTLTDALKYDKRSSYSSTIQWY